MMNDEKLFMNTINKINEKFNFFPHTLVWIFVFYKIVYMANWTTYQIDKKNEIHSMNRN